MTTPSIDPTAPPSGPGCLDCDNAGGWWFHLRRCAACGHIGCCDDSLSRHASAHAAQTGHPIIQSYEPGENWYWDYSTNDYSRGPDLAPPQSRPADQSAPGPADRVPPDWADQIRNRTD